MKLVSVSDATWPVWKTRGLKPVCCRFLCQRGRPERLTCSACWLYLCMSWDCVSSCLPPLPRKLRAPSGAPWADGGPRPALCWVSRVYWRQHGRGCSVSCGFAARQVWTASRPSCSTVHRLHGRVPFSWPGRRRPPLSLVMLDESCCRSSCDSPQ